MALDPLTRGMDNGFGAMPGADANLQGAQPSFSRFTDVGTQAFRSEPPKRFPHSNRADIGAPLGQSMKGGPSKVRSDLRACLPPDEKKDDRSQLHIPMGRS